MSRTATATPPPPYFPPRNATPTMRHCSAPTVTAAHFASRPGHHSSGKRRTKKLPSSFSGLAPSSAKKAATEALGRSFERITSPRGQQPQDAEIPLAVPRSPSPASIEATSSADSFSTSHSEFSLSSPTVDDSSDHRDQEMDRSTPTPSMSASESISFDTTPLPTPVSSRAPSLLQQEGVLAGPSTCSLGLVIDGQEASPEVQPPVQNPPTPARPSWVPNFGKMAKAVVHTGMSMGMSFAEKRSKRDATVNSPRQVESTFTLSQPLPRPAHEELQQLPEDQALARKREWAAAEHRRVTECARLCSQWPHSGYNLAKCGPNGEPL